MVDDLVAPDVGHGSCPIVDMGPYERFGQCPYAEFSWSIPPDGVVDARYPHEPDDADALLGRGSPDSEYLFDRILLKLTPTFVEVTDPDCWQLCETAEQGGAANSINEVTIDPSFYAHRIHLARPITAGAVTTITYLGSGDFVEYTAHPANADADSESGPPDILFVIDMLNGIEDPPWGIYSQDIDHSHDFLPADILAVIDLLNGAGEFDPWNGVPLPVNTTCQGSGICGGGEGAAAGGGSGGAGALAVAPMETLPVPVPATSGDAADNSAFSDGFVRYLATAAPADPLGEEGLRLVVGELTTWCVEHFSREEKLALAEWIREASSTFQSPAVAEMAPRIVEALLD